MAREARPRGFYSSKARVRREGTALWAVVMLAFASSGTWRTSERLLSGIFEKPRLGAGR